MNSPTAAAPPLTHAEIRSIIIGVLVAMFLAALDQTIVATAMPTIGAQLGDFEQLPWVVTSYLLAATAVTPLYGKLSDILGRRTTLLIGISIFMVGSVLCALAPTMLTLIIARAVQGLGGGGLISLAQTVIADIVAPQAGETVITKHYPNSFVQTPLDEELKKLGVKQLVLAGFMTHMCVNSTARGAFNLGYAPTVVAAATATRTLAGPDSAPVPAAVMQSASLAAMSDLFAVVVPDAAGIPD